MIQPSNSSVMMVHVYVGIAYPERQHPLDFLKVLSNTTSLPCWFRLWK